MEKPVCGSEADAAAYDFPLHVGAVCEFEFDAFYGMQLTLYKSLSSLHPSSVQDSPSWQRRSSG